MFTYDFRKYARFVSRSVIIVKSTLPLILTQYKLMLNAKQINCKHTSYMVFWFVNVSQIVCHLSGYSLHVP